MENSGEISEYIFKPEKKFLEHADEAHEYSLEKKTIDDEYQRELRNFLLTVLEEANAEIFDGLKYYLFVFEKTSDIYCSFSLFLSEAITPQDPRGRVSLDKEMQKNLYKEKGIRNLSDEECNEFITQAYAKKVDLNKLLSLMDNQTDQARKNLLLLIIQIIDPHAIPKRENEVEIEMAQSTFHTGGCAMAEKHMLAYISGKHIKPESGYVNLIVNNDGSPLMLD